MFDLAFIWAGLIAFAVLAYVLFDGFDLGIGILFPSLKSESDRALAALVLLYGLYKRREASPLLAALALFVLCYIGLGISLYPYIVPPSVTIWSAAAPDSSLKFLLVGAGVLIPLILAYTALSYWVFRGKVDSSAGYH